MGDLILFHGFDEKTWREIEAGLRQSMGAGGADAAMMDWIFSDLKPRYAAVQTTLTANIPDVPPACVPAVQSARRIFESKFRSIQMEMFLQLLILECDLYFARHSRPSTLDPGFAEKVRLSSRLFGVIEGGKGD